MPPKKKAGSKASAPNPSAGADKPSAKKNSGATQSKENAEKKGKGKLKADQSKEDTDTEPKIKTVKQIIGGDSWTGKLPQTLLYEAAVKNKWQTPFYTMRTLRGSGGYVSTVVLKCENIKTKEIEEVTFAPPSSDDVPDGLPAHLDTALEARHYAATYALHRISAGKNMTLMLPPKYRDFWALFEVQRKQDVDKPWKYSSDPFLVKRERKAAEAEKQAAKEKFIKEASTSSSANPGGSWTRMPLVELSKSARSTVETLIKNHYIWNSEGVKLRSDERKRIVNKFTALDFRRSHVEEACDWARDEGEVFEWLLIHVPEDDLPSCFLPENYSGGSITFAIDPLSLDYKIKRLCVAGYSAEVARDALLRYGEDEHKAAEYLLHSLLGNPTEVDEDLISFEDDLLNAGEPLEQTWEEEVVVTESILGASRVQRVDSNVIKITLEPSGKDLPKKMILQAQKSKSYPNEIGIFTVLTEPTLPAHVRLAMTKKIGEYASELKGQNMIYLVADWIESNIAAIVEDPGRLRDIQRGIIGAAEVDNPVPTPEEDSDMDDRPGVNRKIDVEMVFKQREERMETEAQKHMLKTRQSLPAWKMKEKITKVVKDSQVIIISGETGSGKSTQAVQFILDQEISSMRQANIVCTQPRRISAIGLAERVSQERCSTLGQEVGYAIRGEAKISKDTQITFMTTGVLLRRLRSGLKDITHIFIDEVHERSVDTDYLLVLLRRLIAKKNIKLILMSATLDVDLFTTYFSGWKVSCVNIEGRTYPVQDFYLDDVLRLTDYEFHDGRGKPIDDDTKGMESSIGATIRTLGDKLDYKLLARLVEQIDRIELRGQDGSILIFLSGMMEISRALNQINDLLKHDSYVALPLHASLLPNEQMKVFQRFHGKRKIICATNVAETSITINDVVAVIDTGRVKETSFDSESGLVRLAETWASRDAGKQRRGRAGRVRSGKCFKLYTRNTESNRMAASTVPEILRIPLENLVLSIKAMGVENVSEFLKAAPTPPDEAAVEEAHEILKRIGALDDKLKLTGLGRHLSLIPADLRCAKLMIYGAGLGILSAGVAIASIISSRSPFMSSPDKREESKASRISFGRKNGDLVADYRAYQEWRLLRKAKVARRDVQAWCDQNNISRITLNEIASNESYFMSSLKEIGFVPRDYDHEKTSSVEYQALNSQSEDDSFLRAVVAAAFQPNIARIAMPEKKYASTLSGAKELDPEARTIKFFSRGGRVFLHPSSTLFEAQGFVNNAAFLAFASQVVTSKPFIRDVTPINTLTLLLFGGNLTVDLSGNGLRINEWIRVRGWARVGALVMILRSMLDDALQKKFADPTIDLQSLEIMRCIRQLIRDDGKVN